MKDVLHREQKFTILDWVKVLMSGVSVFSLMAGAIGAWSVMQHRLDTYERQLFEIKNQVKDMEKVANDRHELLVQLRTDMVTLTKLAEEQRALLLKVLSK